jgi:acyl carrier protein
MSDKQILEKIKNIFVKEFESNAASINPETKIYKELELDSLDSVDLIVALENEFNFKVNRTVDESVLKNITAISHIIDYVKQKI